MRSNLSRLKTSAISMAMVAFLSGCTFSNPQLSAASSPAGERVAPSRAERPMNVLMIISDDLNTRLGAYGAPVITPNIDRLAQSGVRFEQAHVQFPWCAPSRASFLTGLRPDTTRIFDLSTHIRTTLPNIITLPQYFRQNGYFSGRVGKVFHQGVPGGIGRDGPDDKQSWDQAINPRGRDKDAEEEGRIIPLTPGIGFGSGMSYLPDEGSDEEQTDGKVATETIRMLEANRDRPFFIATGFYRPHVPEVAPRKYFDLYPLATLKLAEETPETLAGILPAARRTAPANLGMSREEQLRAIQAYYAATSFMDAQVGRVLDAVNRLGLQDNTIVIFMSDHGYALGEHGEWTKVMLWDQVTRAPLIIRAPGMAGNGRSSPRLVEYLDLYPTLLEAAGLPAYPRNQGKSLMPLMRNPSDRRWTKPAYSQVQGGRSVRTDRYRFTEWEGGTLGQELYDYHTDPLEHRNLAGDPRYAGLVARLRALLPRGPVEKKMPLNRYHPDKDCIDLPPQAPASVGRRCSDVQAGPARGLAR